MDMSVAAKIATRNQRLEHFAMQRLFISTRIMTFSIQNLGIRVISTIFQLYRDGQFFFFFGCGKPSTYWCLLSGACLV